jgi:DNA-binding CsgD family transcriptional regulator
MPGVTDRPPFIGRQQELARLVARIQTMEPAGGGLVLVGGEPGIGKTRIVQELADRARRAGWQVLLGRAYDTTGMPPYLPFAEALRPHLRSCPSARLRAQIDAGAHAVALLVPDLHQRLPDLPPHPPLSPEHARYRLFEAVTDVLLAIARDGAAPGDAGADAPHPDPPGVPAATGLLLVLEDLHWADAPTLQLLLHLARRLGEAPLLVVGTHRTVEVGPAHPLTAVLADLGHERLAEHVPLTPFSADDAAALITALSGGPVAPELVHALHQETAGLPFFLEEVVRQLVRDGRDLTDAQGGAAGAWGLPAGVQQAIGRRLARLSPAAYGLVQAGAVVGDRFGFEVAAAMCRADPAGSGTAAGGPDPLLDALDEVLEAGVVREDGAGYQFHHALIRRSLIDPLTLPRRQRLHLRAAEALEQVHARDLAPYIGELATHYHQAGPAADPETTIGYLCRAADGSAGAFAWEEAAMRWQAALALLAPDDAARRCALLLRLGGAQSRVGDSEDARRSFQDAADLARRTAVPEQLAEAAMGFALTFIPPVGPLQQTAVALLEAALDALAEGDSTLRARVLGQLAALQRPTAAWEWRDALSRQAVAMARRLGDLPTLADVLVRRHWAIGDTRILAERQALIEEVLALAEQTGDPALARDVSLLQVMTTLELGDAAAFAQAIDRYNALAHQLRTANSMLGVLQLQAMREMMVGRLTVAEDRIRQVRALAKRAHLPGVTMWPTLQQGYLRLYQGRAGEVAGTVADDLLAAAPAPLQRSLRGARAHLLARAGRLAEARTEFEQGAVHDFADLHRYGDEVLVLVHFADACVLLGDTRRAALLYRQLLPFRTRAVVGFGGYVFHGAVAYYLGLLAATCAHASRPEPGTGTAAGRPGHGSAATAEVDWETAVDHFEAALALHARLGARMWVAHTQCAYAALLRDRRRPADRQRARALLEEAVTTFTELGLTHAATAARQVLPSPAQAATAEAPTFPDGLSAREVEVLRLIAAGRSNKDIAAALVISPNTVFRHVTHIFAKTGTTNRAEAATYAHRHGLAS